MTDSVKHAPGARGFFYRNDHVPFCPALKKTKKYKRNSPLRLKSVWYFFEQVYLSRSGAAIALRRTKHGMRTSTWLEFRCRARLHCKAKFYIREDFATTHAENLEFVP